MTGMYDLISWPGIVVARGTLPEMWKLAEGCGDLHIFCGSRRVIRNAGSAHARYHHMQRAKRR